MTDLFRKKLLLTLALSFLLVTAGCSGLDEEEKPETQIQLESDLSSLQNQYQQVNGQVDSADSQISTASSRGVDVSNATADLDRAQSALQSANSSLGHVQDELNNSNYDTAESLLDTAEEDISEANRTQNSAVVALENSYDTALNQSREKLQSAYYEYQVAVAYVNDAGDDGASVDNLRERVEENEDSIQQARMAIASEDPPNPKEANRLSERIERESTEIQEKAQLSAKEAAATHGIARVGGKIDAENAESWMDRARSAGKDGQLDDVEKRLVFAQYAEQISLYEEYTGAVSAENGIRLSSLNTTLSEYRATVSNGEIPEDGVKPLEEKAHSSQNCLEELLIAESETRAAMREQAVLIEANFTEVESLMSESEDELSSGDYKAACSKAREAQDESKDIAEDLVERKKKPFFVLNLPNPFSDTSPIDVSPPDIDEISIESLELTYTQPTDIETNRLEINTNPVNIETADGGNAGSGVDFQVNAENAGECGVTCREVQATLSNVGMSSAHDVSVRVTIFVDTENGDQVWSKDYEIGELQSGEAVTRTDDVHLGVVDANAVRSNGAKIVLEIESVEEDERIVKKNYFS